MSLIDPSTGLEETKRTYNLEAKDDFAQFVKYINIERIVAVGE